ncbi:hypothetical protein [Modestobacter marinus]|uniref:hypothetical protein n=1 Tax=Modestobacter marinus TaxID=477641 RepID=UPI001C9893D9|nr:hypothetical protein [Modestobacter marinus]
MTSERQHREVVVQLRPGGDPEPVSGWLRRHDFDVSPLVVGLLATGDAAAVRAAFGAEPEGELPVPEELRGDVELISVVPPKQLYPSG